MPLYQYECESCGISELVLYKLADLPSGREWCPQCTNPWRRVVRKAPAGRVLRSYEGETAVMQQSLKERFMKTEIEDVRHKHGVAFDDSLRGAAVDRIMKGEA